MGEIKKSVIAQKSYITSQKSSSCPCLKQTPDPIIPVNYTLFILCGKPVHCGLPWRLQSDIISVHTSLAQTTNSLARSTSPSFPFSLLFFFLSLFSFFLSSLCLSFPLSTFPRFTILKSRQTTLPGTQLAHLKSLERVARD